MAPSLAPAPGRCTGAERGPEGIADVTPSRGPRRGPGPPDCGAGAVASLSAAGAVLRYPGGVADVLPSGERVEEPSDFGALKPGTRLGRYELLIPVARGGMARVWAARQHGQRGFQKLVAIKTILPQLSGETDFERMFLEEARIASGVHHPNVSEIYELGDERGTLYLAMEWVSGDSLARLLRASGKAEPLDPRVAARILADACAGMHAAHELTDDDGQPLGVVHRDVSPQNVLLTADGVTKVCDFGVAKALGQLHEHTTAGQIKGKVSYMSPEQVTGAPVDRRSDVFSLGCVLYEVTTGSRPFKGDLDHIIMQSVMSGNVERPSALVSGYPEELERVVLRALSHEPDARYPSAESMRFALEEFLTRGPLVTQSNVAQVLRERLGEQIDRRRERIRQAMSVAEPPAWSLSPPSRDAQDHRSGVQASSRAGAAAAPTMPAARARAPSVAAKELTGPSAPFHGSVASAPTAPSAIAPTAAPGVPPPMPRASLPPPGATPARPSMPPRPPMPSSAGHHLGYSSSGLSPRGPLDHSSVLPGPPPLPSIPPPGAGASVNPFGSTIVYDASSSSLPIDEARPAAGAKHYVTAALIGVLVAGAISVGIGLVVLRDRAPSTSSEATASASASPAAPAPRPPAPSATASAKPAAPSGDIVIDVTPAEAILVVDGEELAEDARTVARPAAGESVTVAVRATGYGEAIVTIDASTESPIAVALEPLPFDLDGWEIPPAPPAQGAPGDPAAPPAWTRPKSAPAELPDNPY